jgi:hypothetical protein
MITMDGGAIYIKIKLNCRDICSQPTHTFLSYSYVFADFRAQVEALYKLSNYYDFYGWESHLHKNKIELSGHL